VDVEVVPSLTMVRFHAAHWLMLQKNCLPLEIIQEKSSLFISCDDVLDKVQLIICCMNKIMNKN